MTVRRGIAKLPREIGVRGSVDWLRHLPSASLVEPRQCLSPTVL